MTYSDISFATLFTASLAAVASAFTTPVGQPTGNPISKPTLNERVPVGAAYPITWQPTCAGTVSIILLRGPATNVVPLRPLVEKYQNSGSYAWTPTSDLEDDVTGYGIQIICDSNGAFQYSTQFGISNPSYSKASTTAASASVSASATASGKSTYLIGSSTIVSESHASTTKIAQSSSVTLSYASTTVRSGTVGTGTQNITIVRPTGSMSVPASLKTTYTQPSLTQPASVTATGGASYLGANVAAMAGLVAAAAFAL